jgi:hypothetical protein
MTNSNKSKKRGQKILQRMLDMKKEIKSSKASYSCHTESPYRDGYGDGGYGDYSDA